MVTMADDDVADESTAPDDVVGEDVKRDLTAAVGAVEDPEMAVGIGALGMVRAVEVDPASGAVAVRLVSTYAGCPAQLFIERDVAAALPGRAVHVGWDPLPWSPDDVTPAGRAALAEVGIAVPAGAGATPTCPYCGGTVEITSTAGSSLCRSLGYCATCRNPVDVLKHPGAPDAAGPAPSPRVTPVPVPTPVAVRR